MSYAIADIIYGISGDDFLLALKKVDFGNKELDNFLSELGFEEGDDDEPASAEEVFDAIKECDMLDSVYRGNGKPPYWLGVEIGGFDEACTYQKVAEINFTPTEKEKKEYLKNLKDWPKIIVDVLPEPYVFFAWGSS